MPLYLNANKINSASAEMLHKYLDEVQSNSEILLVLENIGKLPDNFDGQKLIGYLDNKNSEIRYWAVKNVGKLTDLTYADRLLEIARNDRSSMVRREAVSSLGRMRHEDFIPRFIELLDNPDPKIVMQAMRALLVFKGKAHVDSALQQLKEHANEQIQQVLQKEYGSNRQISDFGKHAESPNYMRNTVVLGDVQEILKHIPDGSVHLTFTSPPYYNARDYSVYDSYEGYLNFLKSVFTSVHRVTKEGRFLIVNTSPIIIPRISRAYSSKRYAIPFDLHGKLTQIGWEFIDEIIWVKPESSVKNRNAQFFQQRKPLGYKPNPITEHLMVYRKLTTKLIDWNMNQYDDEVVELSKVDDEYESSNVWEIAPAHDKLHSATFPQELCTKIIKYYSYVGDMVFDPFAGSGTLGIVARNLDRYFFMTEIVENYFHSIRERLAENRLGTLPACFLDLKGFVEKIKSQETDS